MIKRALFNGQGDFAGTLPADKNLGDYPGCFELEVTPTEYKLLTDGKARAENRQLVFTDPSIQLRMTPAHETHLEEIMQSFDAAVNRKYRAGVAQHGGMLWTKPRILDKALEECVDQYVFLYTLKQQMETPGLIDENAKDIDE